MFVTHTTLKKPNKEKNVGNSFFKHNGLYRCYIAMKEMTLWIMSAKLLLDLGSCSKS